MNAEEFITCPICLDIAIDAVESNCCTVVYCLNCSQTSCCPTCRASPFIVKPNKVIRRMVSSLPVECVCGSKITRGDMESHEILCSETIHQCSYNCCTFSDKTTKFLAHIQENHQRDLISIFTGKLKTVPNNEPDSDSITITEKPKVKCLYDYNASSGEDLTFRKGDIIIIHQKDPNGWWEGELNGKIGWVPANYVQEI